jgi:hypothetical protein
VETRGAQDKSLWSRRPPELASVSSQTGPYPEQRFKITVARDRHFKRDVAELVLTLDDLDVKLRALDERDDKDGLCYVAATLLGLKRNLKSVDEVHLLVYDIDGGQTEDALREILADADIVAFLHSTYSHKSKRTQILTDHYERWAKQAKAPTTPSLSNLKQYLAAKGKGHLTNIKWDDVNGAWERVADVGNCYIVHHDPVDKFRVLLPLNKPIVVSKLANTNAKCNDAYKAIYHGVGQHFGFAFDEACSDPTRLYYFPSCPKGKADIAVYRTYDGALLDWESITRAEIKPTAATAKGVMVKPAIEVDGRNLRAWEPNRGEFDIEGLIEQYMSGQILAPRSNGGFTITCPFEAEHSDVGGSGTFASNANGSYPWNIHCSHASCQSENRKRLDFLREWIAQELLTVAELEAFSGKKVPPKRETKQAVLQAYLDMANGKAVS